MSTFTLDYPGILFSEQWTSRYITNHRTGRLYNVRETLGENAPRCFVIVHSAHEATITWSSRPLSDREAARARVAAKRHYRKMRIAA